jgi:hypothetical protein
MPEAEEVDNIDINASDLRVDTFRASGSGGQHVNKTDSAIRLTHLPTGTVEVRMRSERSPLPTCSFLFSEFSACCFSCSAESSRDCRTAIARALFLCCKLLTQLGDED